MRKHLFTVLIVLLAGASPSLARQSLAPPPVASAPSRLALPNSPAPALVEFADAAEISASDQNSADQAGEGASAGATVSGGDPSQRQPKRILGLMPNYRAVSAGAVPPPPTAGRAFVLATENTFDYSSFVFVGLTSLLAKGTDAHPDLGKGVPGLWAYTWRGFVDKTDGNYLVLFALPTLLHEDERYYAMGHGRKLRRAIYAADSVLVARDYHGRNTFNASEVAGRGIAQVVSTTYYPSQDSTVGDVSERLGYSIMRDALTNAFREFWPDIATHVLRLKQ